MSLMEIEAERQSNPVDMIEFVAANNDWSFERSGEDEIAMTVEGRWTDYHISFSWMEEFEALHIACAFDIKVSEPRANEVIKLLSCINGQVLMGHFDLWRQEDIVIFRQSLLLSNALDTCEAYYQAFQFVVWSGIDANRAMEAVLFETVGEA